MTQRNRRDKWVIEDCGPVMNMVSREVFSQLDIDYSFNEGRGEPSKVVWLEPWDFSVKQPDEFAQAVELLREIAFRLDDCCADRELSETLIIDRTPMPPFYGNKGSARIKGYGAARRRIRNLRMISFYLSLSGVDHALYAPGQHSIWCQIRHFSQASKATGIRGAEWANAAWFRGTTRLRILYPDVKPNSLLENYLTFLGLEYEIVVVPGPYPKESYSDVKTFVRRDPRRPPAG